MSETRGILQGSVIEAAGAIVERQSAQGRLIAVVHRERYGPEWTLPKGKRRHEESWQETAAREVLEETGLKPVIIGTGGCTFYLVDSRPKVVVYWRMNLEEEPGTFAANEETKELRWLCPAEAALTLTHREEIGLIRSIFLPRQNCRPKNVLELVGRQIALWLHSNPLRRLDGTIGAYEIELSGCALRSPDLARALPSLRAGLARARFAARDGRLDEGWKCLLTVQRTELLYLSTEDLRAAALVMRSEASKLNTWRKAAVLDLVGGRDTASFTPERVFKAAAVRDEHYHNEAYKDILRRGNALMLACFLVLIIGSLLYMAREGSFQALTKAWDDNSFGLQFFSLLTLVSLLGANVSAITDLAQDRTSARIPEMVATLRVTIIRLFIGPASAIFLFFVAQASQAQALIKLQITGGYGILVVAFIAGFSERLVLRVVRSIVGNSDRQ